MSWEHLQDIERRRIVLPDYVHMRLNRLEKPEPWSVKLQTEIAIELETATLQRYPSYEPFYHRLADFFGAPVERLVVGAGIEEFIRNLFMLAGGKVAILWPTCAMFELYARIFNVPLLRIVTPPSGPQPALPDALDDDVRLVLLANPGQPVDTLYSLDELRAIAAWCDARGATLAVDEAYHGFGAPTALPLIDEFARVTVLRTFSKAFGAASIRLGFAVSSPAVHRELNAVRQSGEVSAMSMTVARVLMNNFDRVQAAIDHTIAGRDWLRNRLIADGLEARGDHANHVLIGFRDAEHRATVGQRLADRGILIKADYPAPLARHALVTCGSVQLMTDFHGELARVV